MNETRRLAQKWSHPHWWSMIWEWSHAQHELNIQCGRTEQLRDELRQEMGELSKAESGDLALRDSYREAVDQVEETLAAVKSHLQNVSQDLFDLISEQTRLSDLLRVNFPNLLPLLPTFCPGTKKPRLELLFQFSDRCRQIESELRQAEEAAKPQLGQARNTIGSLNETEVKESRDDIAGTPINFADSLGLVLDQDHCELSRPSVNQGCVVRFSGPEWEILQLAIRAGESGASALSMRNSYSGSPSGITKSKYRIRQKLKNLELSLALGKGVKLIDLSRPPPWHPSQERLT